MQLPINIEFVGAQSFQNQIFESIRRQILSGQLKPGAPIPSTRILSEQLGVSRNTVVLAYDRLVAEDYIFTQKNVGTFVNANLPDDSLLLKDTPLAERKNEERLWFTPEQRANLQELLGLLDRAFGIMLRNLEAEDGEVAIDEAMEAEQRINQLRDQLRRAHLKSIEAGDYNVKSGLIYNDLFSSCEKVGDHVINVSEALAGEV